MSFAAVARSVVQENPRGRELVEVLSRIGTKEATPFITTKALDDGRAVFRASQIASLCAREEVLASLYEVNRSREIDAVTRAIFDTGSALHDMVRAYLADAGVLAGSWKCLECAAETGGKAVASPGRRLRPKACSKCGKVNFQYVEEYASDGIHLLGGHCDGFLYLGPKVADDPLGAVVIPDSILEIKSIGARSMSNILRAPYNAHFLQAQAYLWLFGLRRAKVLYVAKDWSAAKEKNRSLTLPFVEHDAARDEAAIDALKAKCLEVIQSIRRREVPPRVVCQSRHDPKARECPLVARCFA